MTALNFAISSRVQDGQCLLDIWGNQKAGLIVSKNSVCIHHHPKPLTNYFIPGYNQKANMLLLVPWLRQ